MTRSRLLAVAHLIAIVTLSAPGCQPKTGADRFVGTFRWRQLFGYQGVTLEEGGKATYSIVTPGEGDADPPETELFPSTYRVVGDTAFMVVVFPDPAERNDTLAFLLRGDTLIMLNQVLGGNPLFIRED